MNILMQSCDRRMRREEGEWTWKSIDSGLAVNFPLRHLSPCCDGRKHTTNTNKTASYFSYMYQELNLYISNVIHFYIFKTFQENIFRGIYIYPAKSPLFTKNWWQRESDFDFSNPIYRVLFKYPPITYYWTVPLILDHSYLVGKLIQKCQDFKGSKAFVSAIFEFVKFPTRYEWSNMRRPVH